jgi:hypothetical protein
VPVEQLQNICKKLLIAEVLHLNVSIKNLVGIRNQEQLIFLYFLPRSVLVNYACGLFLIDKVCVVFVLLRRLWVFKVFSTSTSSVIIAQKTSHDVLEFLNLTHLFPWLLTQFCTSW